MKKTVSLFLIALLVVAMSVTAFATANSEPYLFDGDFSNGEQINGNIVYEAPLPTAHAEITFAPPSSERISSNGDFHYCIAYSIESGSFTANKTSVKITANAYIGTWTGEVVSNTTSHKYTFIVSPTNLFGSGGGEKQVTTGSASASFSVTKGNSYKLVIENNDGLEPGTYVYGDGHISNITVN